jgi:hypothetical protein
MQQMWKPYSSGRIQPFVRGALVDAFVFFLRFRCLAFFWLALSSYFIWKLEYIARVFFGRLGTIVVDKKDFPDFVKNFDNIVHNPKAYLCGIPFALGADILVFEVFPEIPVFAQVVMIIFLTELFLIAGIGFWGVASLIRLTQRLEQMRVDINVFHSDRFGGLGFVGSLTIQITLGFSTGSLVIPLALEATMHLQSYISILITQLLTGAYVLMIILSFLVPTFAIHSWLQKLLLDSLAPISERMKAVLNEYLLSEKTDAELRLRSLDSVYEMATGRTKQWPFDLQVILQLVGSVLLPILIALIQILLYR